MKKITVALLVCVLMVGVLLTACNSKVKTDTTATASAAPTAGAPSNTAATQAEIKSTKDLMTVRINGQPETLNTNLSDATSRTVPIQFMVLEALCQTWDNVIVPVLATSWEVDDTGGYTFHLRDDVYFHNGEHMTSEDVVYSYNWAASGNKAALYPWIDYANVKAIDEYTVYIPVTEFKVTTLSNLTSTCIYSKKANEGNEDDPNLFQGGVIGTGPYKMADWIAGSDVTVEAFDDYWGGKPYIKTVRYRPITEMAVALMEVETGGVDLIIDASYAESSKYDQDENAHLVMESASSQFYTYIGINLADPIMNSYLLRKALWTATDRDAIMDGSFNGTGHKTISMLPETAEGAVMFDDNTWPIKYDVEEAKKMIAEAGYPNGLELTMVVDGDATRQLMAEQLKSMYAKIGVEININQLETATASDLLTKTTEGWHMWLRRAGGTGAGTLQMIVQNNIGKLNHWEILPTEGYNEVSAMLEEYSKTADDAKRVEMSEQFQEDFINKYLWWYPVQHADEYILYNEKLQNLEWSNYWQKYNIAYFN